MNRIVSAKIGLLLLCFTPVAHAAHEEVAAELKTVVQANLEATQGEDLDKVMATVHTQSPSYLGTKQAMPDLFENFDLNYNILSLKVVGTDDEYAYARVKQETKKVAGPAFRDNQVDMLQIFRKEDDKWKFWSQAILEIKFLDE